jgi:hypothetical protein
MQMARRGGPKTAQSSKDVALARRDGVEKIKALAKQRATGKANRARTARYRADALRIWLNILMDVALLSQPDPDKLYELGAAIFNEQIPHHGIKDVKTTMFRDLHIRVAQTGSIEDRPRSGRPPKLTPDQVKRCIVALKKGVGNRRTPGTWYGFTSFEHAARESPVFMDVLNKSGAGLNALEKAMKKMNRKPFRKIKIHIKYSLGNDNMRLRLAAAKVWSTWQLRELEDVIWIDEKKEYVGVSSYSCYAPDDMDSYKVEGHSVLGHLTKISYIAAVSARLGPVYFAVISGTTDWDSGFTVRTRIPLFRNKAPPTATRNSPRASYDAEELMHVFPADSHEAKAMPHGAAHDVLINNPLLHRVPAASPLCFVYPLKMVLTINIHY